MNELRGLIARSDGICAPGRVSFDRRIRRIEANARGGDYILPGFVDLQVNGSHGIDVMNASAEALRRLAEVLAAEGTTSFLPTATTAPLKRIVEVHEAIAEAMDAQQGGVRGRPAACIAGMHLEGPFISPARLGAHPRLNLAPRGEALRRILRLKRLKLLTIAPELPGALAAIRRLSARGVTVAIGHSDAGLEQAEAAIAAGARMFTHLFNAMRPLHHRDPGVIAAGLARSPALAAVIPDGVHLDPAILDLVYRVRGPAGMIITTDKVALAQAPAGRLAGPARVRIERGAVRIRGGTLAGSVISMLDGVRLMVERAGAEVGAAALMASTNPARLIGLRDRGLLRVGARADIVLLDRNLSLKAVFAGGRELG